MKLDPIKLKLAMARKEYNAVELAKITDLSRNTITGYMNGSRMPRIELLGKIAKALDVDPADLVEQKGATMEKIPRMETINRAAELTGLSYSVIYNLCKENRIVYIKTGRKYLINMENLTVFLNRGEEECPGGVNIKYV